MPRVVLTAVFSPVPRSISPARPRQGAREGSGTPAGAAGGSQAPEPGAVPSSPGAGEAARWPRLPCVSLPGCARRGRGSAAGGRGTAGLRGTWSLHPGGGCGGLPAEAGMPGALANACFPVAPLPPPNPPSFPLPVPVSPRPPPPIHKARSGEAGMSSSSAAA